MKSIELFKDYPDVMSTEQACKALSMGRNSFFKLLHSGEIKSLTVGTKYLIPKLYLIDYLEAHRCKTV